ncbi:MAG: hypothetical protein H6578_06920 [Chitinophagales bacterium]|nr:hypothetical protein [Chitinophagales bacterium]
MKNLLSLFLVAIIFLFACNTRSKSTAFSADSFTFNIYTPYKDKPNIKEFQVIVSKDGRNDTIYINDSNAFKLFFNTATQNLEYEKVNELNNEIKFYSITDMANGFLSKPVLSVKNIEGEKIEYAIYGEANLLDNTKEKDGKLKTFSNNDDVHKILGDSSILDNTLIEIKTDFKKVLGDSSILDNTLSNYNGDELYIILGDSSILDNTVAEMVEDLKKDNESLNNIDDATLTQYVKEEIRDWLTAYTHFGVNLKYPVYISVKYDTDGNSYFQLNYDASNYLLSKTIGSENRLYRNNAKFTNIGR